MMNLLLAEGSRLWARRMTRYFPLILAALMLAGIVIAYFVITNNDDSVDFVNDIGGGVDARSMLGPITVLLPIMAFVIGASYVGADIKTGMLEQLLTWEPRRLRLLSARAIACLVSATIIAGLLALFFVALAYGLSSAAGTVDGATGEFWGNVAKLVLRTGVAAGLFCAFGLGITVMVNSSMGSIVAFVIYWFVVENLITAFLSKVAVYLPIQNANAFASGEDVERLEGSIFGGGDVDFIVSHSYITAGLILAGWTLAAVLGAAFIFNRRDIA